MNSQHKSYQVAIVGGGAVGLFLGICLQKVGISCVILEKRLKIREGSRSLGIHPVALELFKKLDMAETFTQKGIQITKGHAFANTEKLGSLSFEGCARLFNYILALPQYKTETLLEKQLDQLNSDVLIRGAEVSAIKQSQEKVQITYQKENQATCIETDFLVGCDGKNSFVREQSKLSFEGKLYPDTYIMGDFSDNTRFGTDAAIFLCDEGLIESFPLNEKKRRWVVKTDNYIPDPKRQHIDERVLSRIGHNLTGTKQTMLSSFGVQKLLAKPMVNHRVILAGDAAHVVSPIGGQGMNLGWLGAWDLACCFDEIIYKKNHFEPILQQFELRRRKAARTASHRAEMNMRLGRKSQFPVIRNSLVSLMLTKPISRFMAQLFTMRGVERWVI